MIIIISLISFILLMAGLSLSLIDFTRFVVKRVKNISLPKTYINLGEYAVTVFAIFTITFLGLLFYKFAIAFCAYIFSDNLISFYVNTRGVFSVTSDLQKPLTLIHLLLGLLLTPALQFLTSYLIYRGIRSYMLDMNHYYGDIFNESDMLYFGLISSILFASMEIFFYSQYLPNANGITHLIYLIISRLPLVCYFLAIAHLQLLKDENYKSIIGNYIELKKHEARIIFSRYKTILLTYFIGIILYLPFFSGTQFISNKLLLIIILVCCSISSLVMLRLFLSKGFNYMAVIMFAESDVNIMSHENLIDVNKKKRIVYVIYFTGIIILIFKFKLVFMQAIGVAGSIVILFLLFIFIYLMAFLASLVPVLLSNIEKPEISITSNLIYILNTFKALIKSGTAMAIFILFVFILLGSFPKKLNYKNDDYINSIVDVQNNPLFIEYDSINRCIPIAYGQLPDFFLKCLYNQEDRSFLNQNSLLPQASNWHGFSLASFYRIFSGGGGSNLNQQLIKNILFKNNRVADIQRKFTEALSAIQLSLQTPPEHIATMYCNEVGFNGANGHTGIMMASLSAFGLPVNRINNLEMMYLAATVKCGNKFKTSVGYVNYKDAIDYSDAIKSALLDQAKSWYDKNLISRKELNMLKQQELRFISNNYKTISATTTNTFLKNQIKVATTETATYFSSITQDNQQYILNAVKSFDVQFQKNSKESDTTLYSAALVVNVESGKIIGHYGGSGISDLTQLAGGNQMGSVIKPFILLEMLEMGYNAENIRLFDGKIKGKITPDNYNGICSDKYVGIDTILSKSLNVPMVNIREMMDAISLYKEVEDRFARMNIPKYLYLDNPEKNQENEINYPLGSRNMTLFNIAQIYQVLFNNGYYKQLTVIDSAYDPVKNLIIRYPQKERRIYFEENCQTIISALSHTTEYGTGSHLMDILPKGRSFYCKTGTTDKCRHGYTVLFSGTTLIVTYTSFGTVLNNHLSLGVKPIPFNSGGKTAGVLAALIYNEMNK